MTDEEKYRYWFKEIILSQGQQPVKEWEAAEARLQIKKSDLAGARDRGDDDEPYVNGFRLLYESLKSFLDQRDAMFKVVPSKPFASNEYFIKRAECEKAYLEYVWAEQDMQKEESKKLDSVLQRNVGFTLVGFDNKKWLPTLRYLPARDVLLDSNTGGIFTNSNWIGYKEYIPIEEFISRNEVSDAELDSIRKHTGSTLPEEAHTNLAQDESTDSFKKLFDVVTIYHIFARNASAVRKVEEGEVKKPSKSVVEEMNLTVPKVYLKFVKGIMRPLTEDDWPYDLDDREFPIEILKFNTPVESLYGYTDNRQMRRTDTLLDAIVNDIEHASFREGRIKYTSPKDVNISKDKINAFLNSKDEYYIEGLVTSDGKPLIVPIEQGRLSPGLVKAAELITTFRNEASALGELSAEHIKEYKEVTAIAARLHESNIHQRINRRLNGPEGYEMSIQADAIKIMEIAHQTVPKHSFLEVPGEPIENSDGTFEEGMDYISVPWESALRMLQDPEVSLLKLGIDAIVGPELAEFWITADQEPVEAIKLSTHISIVPGSTRRITEEERAAMLKQYYTEIFGPMYQEMNRWDLAINYLSRIARYLDLDRVEDFIPSQEEAQQFMQQVQQAQQMQMQMEMMQAKQKSEPKGKE